MEEQELATNMLKAAIALCTALGLILAAVLAMLKVKK
jgi:hypothetical protein